MNTASSDDDIAGPGGRGIGADRQAADRWADSRAVRPDNAAVEGVSAEAVPGAVRPDQDPRRSPLPEPDPLIDSDAVGLRKFDLGMVPASVTPPRSWRNAAWFTVTTSMTSLAVLLVTTALFLRPEERRAPDSLPLFPSGTPLPTLQGTQRSVPTVGAPHLLAAEDSESATHPGSESSTDGREYAHTHRFTDPTGTDREPTSSVGPAPSTTHHPGDGRPATASPVPSVTVGEGTPIVDGAEIRDQTAAFFEALGNDVGSAYELVTGELAEAGLPVFSQRYDDVASIDLRHVTINPVEGITVSTVIVTHHDGSQSTEYRELRFAGTTEPLITDDRLIPRNEW
ncbi:hypothetical protein [Actinoalloteichus hymeniacidonis]|uniref:Uncharacterized protein n=1 Tax=Actinoalloteichus hymeniacidonis TaxID=340345 RepID=A0AAC9MZR5_9PSEU|nr:hypothetical protein [Actinoalloteichus hymeniacidonis]AOS65713.1 hypothetical protein TL08_24675 [Actinoalloteichus hymeniacidonis]MBB5906197.1 hypothetical protein [Actinoalloteichus hymeniacidonis]